MQANLLALAEETNVPFVSSAHQMVLNRAKAILLFHQKQYDEFRRHIHASQFAQRDHAQLQILWNEAHYREVGEVAEWKIKWRGNALRNWQNKLY